MPKGVRGEIILADRIGDLHLKTARGRATSHFGPHFVQSPDYLDKDVTANIATELPQSLALHDASKSYTSGITK